MTSERYIGAIVRTALKIGPPDPRQYLEIRYAKKMVTGIRIGHITETDHDYRERVKRLQIPVKDVADILKIFGFYFSTGLVSNVLLYQDLPVVFFESSDAPEK